MTGKFQQGTIKRNAHKTRFFVIWTVELTEEELLKGLGEKANVKAFNTKEAAESFLEELQK